MPSPSRAELELVETHPRATMAGMPESPSNTRAALHRITTPGLLTAALLLFLAGVAVPFFSVTKMWVFRDSVSVLSGLVDLAEADEWFLFLVIFLFTLVFPLIKLGVLSAVWWYRSDDDARADRLLRGAGHLGKWSMLDVFVVAILIVMLKTAAVASIHVGLGVYLFTASVVLTQLISLRLERRLRKKSLAPAQP